MTKTKKPKLGRPKIYPALPLHAMTLDMLAYGLTMKKRVTIKDLGTFTVKRMKARKLKTWGKMKKLSGRNQLCFKTDKEFKKFIQTIKHK